VLSLQNKGICRGRAPARPNNDRVFRQHLLDTVVKPLFNGRSIAVSAVKNGFIDSDRF
jgi:hypothetical protein